MTTTDIGGPPNALRQSAAAPLIAALHARAEDIRQEELMRAEGRWEAVCPLDRQRIEALTRRIVGALLDEPTARLQEESAPDGAHLRSAWYLFGLEEADDDAPTSVPVDAGPVARLLNCATDPCRGSGGLNPCDARLTAEGGTPLSQEDCRESD